MASLNIKKCEQYGFKFNTKNTDIWIKNCFEKLKVITD